MFYIGTKMKGDRVINQIGGSVPDIETAIELCDTAVAERKMTYRVFDSKTKEIKYTKKAEDLSADAGINVKVAEEPKTETTKDDKSGDLYVNITTPYIAKATMRNVRLRTSPRIAKETETGRVTGEHLFTIISELIDATGKVIWVETSMHDWILAEYIQKV